MRVKDLVLASVRAETGRVVAGGGQTAAPQLRQAEKCVLLPGMLDADAPVLLFRLSAQRANFPAIDQSVPNPLASQHLQSAISRKTSGYPPADFRRLFALLTSDWRKLKIDRRSKSRFSREPKEHLQMTFRLLMMPGALLWFAGLLLAQDDDVEILRDTWGIPHIFSDTDAGAFYGLGYATSEDRAFQMTYSLRIIQGRLSEVIGEVRKLNRDETSIDHDRKMRTFCFYRAAQRTAAHLDRETLGLLQAYCDGVNAYFREHQDKLHPLFARTGLQSELWTPADCLASWWHLGQFFATDGTRDLIAGRNEAAGQAPGRGARGQPPGRGGDPL